MRFQSDVPRWKASAPRLSFFRSFPLTHWKVFADFQGNRLRFPDTSGEELSGNEIPNVEEEAEETQETEETDDSISFEIPAEDETVSDPEQDNSEDDGPEDIEDTSEDEEPEAETDVEGSVENEEEIQE